MDISTKTVTTKVHTATATVDDLKGVAILAVKNKLGLSDAAILSSDASAEADGSIAVSIVESVPAASDAPASGRAAVAARPRPFRPRCSRVDLTPVSLPRRTVIGSDPPLEMDAMDAVREELRKRISDPEELAKFERFHRLYERRMSKLGPDAGVPAMMQATMSCWRRAFGAEWPQTKAPSSPTSTEAKP